MRRTKIVATWGPACADEEVLREMIRAGVDVVRLNFSHLTHETAARVIPQVRRLAEEEGRVVAILQDLQGPRVRVGELPAPVELTVDQQVILTGGEPGSGEIPVDFPTLARCLRPGDRILLDDGLIELEVLEVDPPRIRTRVRVGGVLRSHKGINLPTASLDTPALTEKDVEDVAFGVEHGVDYIALSFVRTPEDVRTLRRLLAQHGARIPILAKIEKHEALQHLDAILEVADGVMVARGDLGVEVPPERVPLIQKELLRKANQLGKPAITATQMLDSMVRNPRPTRAEASDVANAILDGTDAVMLSAETAVGKYPVEAVRTMDRIARAVEEGLLLQGFRPGREPARDITEAIGRATCSMADELGASAIVPATSSGYTARQIARFRPRVPIYAVTPSPQTQRRLALVWGVVPLLVPQFRSTDELLEQISELLLERGLVQEGETVLITAGIPFGIPGNTNLLKAHLVRAIVGRGVGLGEGFVVGRLHILEPGTALPVSRGDVLYVPRSQLHNPDLVDAARRAGALLLEGPWDPEAPLARGVQEGGTPVIAEFQGQVAAEEGRVVTVDVARGVVYRGFVDLA